MFCLIQTPHLMVSSWCLRLHETSILEPGALDIGRVALHEIHKITLGVWVFHGSQSSRVLYTPQVISQSQNVGQTKQGILSLIIITILFPLQCFCWIGDRDSWNLINTFMRVTH